ncbi:methyl-accepting chemotaxis protein, partial [Desulfocurvus vexinensis]|uniref:methyl-accepting chemotaxis protein n=1 Tax=Desulfocurvus vexinensis TaxID=399548 RepID=UPI00146FBC7E
MKLGLGFALVLLLTATVAGLSWNSMLGVKNRSAKAEDMNAINVAMFNARVSALYYFLDHDPEMAKGFNTHMAALAETAKATRATYKIPADQATVDAIVAHAQTYTDNFNTYARLQQERTTLLGGVVSSAGELEQGVATLLERLRPQAGRGERFAAFDAATRVQARFLTLRGLAKDYLARPGEQALRLVDEGFAALLTEQDALRAAMPEAERQALTPLEQAARAYRDGFAAYAQATDRQIQARTAMAAAATELISSAEAFGARQNEIMREGMDADLRVILAGAAVALVLGVVAALMITRAITGPVRQGVGFAQAIAAGDLTARIDVNQKDEIGQLAAALQEMVAKLSEVVGEVQSAGENVASGSEEL